MSTPEDLPPDVAAELRWVRAEIAAMSAAHGHMYEEIAAVHRQLLPPAVPEAPSVPPEQWHRGDWLPSVHEGRLKMPERHHRLMRWLHAGVKSGAHLWDRHPDVRTGRDLEFGERAADVMRNAFGSWRFVGGFLAFMAVWMAVNSLFLRGSAWDRYPYILLNLCLSMMAGLQGALILIAAKRSDRVTAELQNAHYAQTKGQDLLLVQNNAMTGRIEHATALLSEIHRHVTAMSPLSGEFPPDAGDDDGTVSP